MGVCAWRPERKLGTDALQRMHGGGVTAGGACSDLTHPTACKLFCRVLGAQWGRKYSVPDTQPSGSKPAPHPPPVDSQVGQAAWHGCPPLWTKDLGTSRRGSELRQQTRLKAKAQRHLAGQSLRCSLGKSSAMPIELVTPAVSFRAKDARCQ